MSYSYSRVALLAGASIAALGLANAASAAPHDGLPAGTYAGEDTTDADVVICDLASTADCFFGVIDETNPASATLNSVASGRVYQHDSGADVALSLVNAAGDSAELGAIANGSSYANASVYTAIAQSALASDDASVDLTNNGTLIINALAAAAYDTAPAVANASASYAVYQYANSTDGGTAQVGLHNNGYMSVVASAVVTGGGTASATSSNTNPAEAYAHARIYAGIDQSASAIGTGGLGYATLVNADDAEINLNANAVATANTGNALAEAIVNYGVFHPQADSAVNYGAIGAIIGHEIMHGFDDQGRKIDSSGAVRDWWTPGDATRFKALTAELKKQYASYEAAPGIFINGDLTMGENIGDMSGLEVAYEAYNMSLNGKKPPVVDGLTGDQRFFLAFAQAWRGAQRADAIKTQVASDPHSPRRFRVIGPLRNLDAWYEAFKIGSDSKFYIPPKKRVRIW